MRSVRVLSKVKIRENSWCQRGSILATLLIVTRTLATPDESMYILRVGNATNIN